MFNYMEYFLKTWTILSEGVCLTIPTETRVLIQRWGIKWQSNLLRRIFLINRNVNVFNFATYVPDIHWCNIYRYHWHSCCLKYLAQNVPMGRSLLHVVFNKKQFMTLSVIPKELRVAQVQSPSNTQGWFCSLHQPLGQLVEFPSMYRWMNTIISLVDATG